MRIALPSDGRSALTPDCKQQTRAKCKVLLKNQNWCWGVCSIGNKLKNNRGKLQGDMLQIDKCPLLEIPIRVGDKEHQKKSSRLWAKCFHSKKNSVNHRNIPKNGSESSPTSKKPTVKLTRRSTSFTV